MLSPYPYYSGRVAAPSAEYPFGAANPESVDGADDGFPLDYKWVREWQGFQQALITAAGDTPDGVVDDINGQVFNDLVHGEILESDSLSLSALDFAPLTKHTVPENQRDVIAYPAGLCGNDSTNIKTGGYDDHITGCAVVGNWAIIITDGPTIDGGVKFVGVVDLRLAANDGNSAVTWYSGAELTIYNHVGYTIDSIAVTGTTVFLLWRKIASSYARHVTRLTIDLDTGVLDDGTGNDMYVNSVNAKGTVLAISADTAIVNNPTGLYSASISILDFTTGAHQQTDGGGNINSAYVCNNHGLATNGTDVFFVAQDEYFCDAIYSCKVSDPTAGGKVDGLALGVPGGNVYGLLNLGSGNVTNTYSRLYVLSAHGSNGTYTPKLTVIGTATVGDKVYANIGIDHDDTPVYSSGEPIGMSYDGIRLWVFWNINSTRDSIACLPVDPMRIHELPAVEATISATPEYTLPVTVALRVPGVPAGLPAMSNADLFVPTESGIRIIRGARWR